MVRVVTRGNPLPFVDYRLVKALADAFISCCYVTAGILYLTLEGLTSSNFCEGSDILVEVARAEWNTCFSFGCNYA